MTTKEFNYIFDHTLLKPQATEADLKKICEQAMAYGFHTVAVNTGVVKACAEMLGDSGVLVDAAVGFPLGITTVACKVRETEEAIANGAGEIDYVVNVGKVKEGLTRDAI